MRCSREEHAAIMAIAHSMQSQLAVIGPCEATEANIRTLKMLANSAIIEYTVTDLALDIKALGLNQKKFAEAWGISRSYLNDILLGRRKFELPAQQQAQEVVKRIQADRRMSLDLTAFAEMNATIKKEGA